MISLFDVFTVKDFAGILYSTQNLLFSLNPDVKIYEIAGNHDSFIVYFASGHAPKPYELRKMSECRIKNNTSDHMILWPQRELYTLSDEQCCGFLAKKETIASDLITLSQMMEQRKKIPKLSGNDIKNYLAVGLNFAKCIDAIHSTEKNYVIGAFDPEEFHIDSEKKIYYFYAYDCGRSNLTLKNYHYLSPELIHYGQWKLPFSEDSDSFAFALILFQLLTGHYPFAISTPEHELTQDTVIKYMLDGESIYYYDNSPQCIRIEHFLSEISPEIAETFRYVFDYCGNENYTADRPTIKEWIQILKKTLTQSDFMEQG